MFHLYQEYHLVNLLQASSHCLYSWVRLLLLVSSCLVNTLVPPLIMSSSSLLLQTPASSPASPATPHTDISTDSGLTTGNPAIIIISIINI